MSGRGPKRKPTDSDTPSGRLLRRAVWLVALPPTLLGTAILLTALWTGASCSPLYRAAPATPEAAAARGLADWGPALDALDARATEREAGRRRGERLGVCP